MPHARTNANAPTSFEQSGVARSEATKQSIWPYPLVADELIRIFSDVHYGDRSSRVDDLGQLRPLCQGASQLVLNGDMLDTRPGPRPEHNAEILADVNAFTRTLDAPITFLSGNHDPNFTDRHVLELAGGAVVLTHGDILYEEIVPWGRDGPFIRAQIVAALTRLPVAQRDDLDRRFAIWRRVAASVRQRHQSERDPLKYAVRFLADTAWPPLRIVRILRAWQEQRARAANLAARHWPKAKFLLIGHTHRPGIWRLPSGLMLINTGSFTLPFGGYTVDLTRERLMVRRIVRRRGEFHAGCQIAEFPLAHA